MTIINLKEGSLEQKLLEFHFSHNQRDEICKDILYHDEYYYLPKSKKIVKGFRQEFNKDPHMKLKQIPEVRLLACEPESTHSEDLVEIFDLDIVPIITRVKAKSSLSNFRSIPNNYGQDTILVPIEIAIPSKAQYSSSPYIRNMDKTDLPTINEMFRHQYSLRYRMVHLMWQACPEACFVFDRLGNILGVTFNRMEEDKLLMRQIFVEEQHRGIGIGSVLYEKNLNFASQRNLKSAVGYIRQETELFHKRFRPKLLKGNEYYIIGGGYHAKLNKE